MFLCFCAAGNALAEATPHHARVALLAPTTSITPGRDLWLAVHFQLDQGWHIYWINPGDSGQPPVLQWQIPAGFRAGEIQMAGPGKAEKLPTRRLWV
ncbi:MAG: hypothetical protein LAP21_26710 [Acidobacteriia bacterium]|nr:hypothetical protein [Terriglobia bacterium]